MSYLKYIFLAFISLLCTSMAAQDSKREFRGAWLHTIYQTQYKKHSTAENKAYLVRQLDSLKSAGINAVIFQVRAQADAFYKSDVEPLPHRWRQSSGPVLGSS